MEDWPPDAPAPTPPSDVWPPPPPPPGEPPAPPPPAVIPWEQPGLPWTTGLVETVKLLLTKPREAFERMPITGDPLRPLVFAILLGWLGAIFNAVWNLAFKGLMPATNAYGGYAMPHHFVLLTALFAPVLIVCGILVGSAIYHLMLMIVGGARGGFVATLRVVCYTLAAHVFQLLPLCGGVIVFVGAILLTIQGFAVVHRITVSKATLAVLLPLALCCACGMVLAATMGAAILSHLSGMQH